jgi:hypothetical protein
MANGQNSGKEEAATARQWGGKHVSTAANQYATTEELLEVVFLCGPCRGYAARTNRKLCESEVSSYELQAGSGSSWLAVWSPHC